MINQIENKLSYTVELVALTAEEVLSQGALYYIAPSFRWNKPPRSAIELYRRIFESELPIRNDIKLLINLDCVGRGIAIGILNERYMAKSVLKNLLKIEEKMNILIYDVPFKLHQGDCLLFDKCKLPYICISRFDEEICKVIHTKYDEFSLLNINDILHTIFISTEIVKAMN